MAKRDIRLPEMEIKDQTKRSKRKDVKPRESHEQASSTTYVMTKEEKLYLNMIRKAEEKLMQRLKNGGA